MFALILALTFNPITHQTGWAVGKDGFKTEEACLQFAESSEGKAYLLRNGALAYNCDQLKDLR